MKAMRVVGLLAGLTLMAGVARAEGDDSRELAQAKEALSKAKVSMLEAIQTATKEGKGAKPFKIDLELEEGQVIFDVELLQGETGPEMEIDAITGKVTKFETVEEQEKEDAKEAGEKEGEANAKEEQEENREKALAAKAMPVAKVTLADAVRTALAEVKDGKAFSAVLEVEGGKAQYAIDLIAGDKAVEVDIDPATGKVMKAESGEGEEEENSEAVREAKACVVGAKNLTAARVSMIEALETAVKAGKGGKPFKADLELDEGKLMYDIELLAGESGPEMEIDAVTGKVLKIESVEEQQKEDAKEDEKQGEGESKEEERENREKAAAAKALPAAKVTLMQAIETAVREVPGGKAYKAEFKPEDGEPRYEIQVAGGSTCVEVVVDGVTRKIIETEEKGSTSPQKEAAEGGWRESFPVKKADFVAIGKNPYFSLIPGTKSIFKSEEGATLTITVLDKTKVVDGVNTRIIEEREEKGGKPEEISLNYFAMDKSTGDVYYFGEDVDEYEGDKVTHPGVWLSGAKGAKFGLIMPAKAKVGDKFYQEIAPKVAMDRAEIVALDVEIKTPAGTFKCVHVKETSPLEKGASHKYYSPGVGLVKDDEFVLSKIESPKE